MAYGIPAPKTDSRLRSAIGLLRPLNGAIALLCIVSAGALVEEGFRHPVELLLAGATGFLLASFGNILNDVIDIPIDRINKPERALPTGNVSISQATAMAAAAVTAGMVCAAFTGPETFMAAGAISVALAAYNMWLKRIPLLGNAVIGMLTASTFVYGGLPIGHIREMLYPALFAFAVNFIRELVKDIEDIEGDRAIGISTYPAVAGVVAAERLAAVLAFFLAASTSIPYTTGEYGGMYIVLVFLLADAPLVYSAIILLRNPGEKLIKKISILLKVSMLGGLLAIISGVMFK